MAQKRRPAPSQKQHSPCAPTPAGHAGSPAPTATVAGGEAELRVLQTDLNQANSLVVQLRQEIETLRQRAQACEYARSTAEELSRELHSRTQRLEQQLTVARQLQRLFLPPAMPEFSKARFSVKYLPAPRVGGDMYDVFDMGNGCVGVLIADASGHGLTATLITAVAKMAFDTFRQNGHSPKAIMEKVNEQILRNTLESHFLTAFLAVIDLENLRMKYVNASHPCPVLYSENRFEALDTEGLCCGMFDEPKYEEKEIQLHPGDRIFFYTRGLLEMVNGNNAAYENRRLNQLLRNSVGMEIAATVERISEDYTAHLGGAEQSEDLTFLGVQILPCEATEEKIVIASDPMQLSRIEGIILARLEALNYGERALFGVRLALEEAIINAIKHGNRMDKSKHVTITYSVDRNRTIVSVEDEGEGFDPHDVPDPTADENLEEPHGRGIVLMRAYMDDISYNAKGNRITLVKKAPWAE